MTKYHIYDIETYPNIFTYSGEDFETGEQVVFEWSERKNDMPEFIKFIMSLAASKVSMVGFNNVSFDYPVIHKICMNYPNITLADVYVFVNEIIKGSWGNRFKHVIWDRDRLVRQIDLYKINHFDNVAKATSLKVLEFNMRSGSIQDLPYTPGVPLIFDQIPGLIEYNMIDVTETKKFFTECLPAVELRDNLSEKFGKDFTNHNDTKIGKDYFIMRLEEYQKGTCWDRSSGRRQPRQTIRDEINLAEVILPYVAFENSEFQRIFRWFQGKTITETKNSIKDLSCTIDDFQFDFGTGGIHGSIESSVVISDTEHVIVDIDVASYYPNIAIVNNLYPEHLGKVFCEIYKDMYLQRRNYTKGTPENAMFKLALNGTYGDSNNKYSPFFDPKFTMGITVNGQLLLCIIAEQMMKIPGLNMIQINTDGLSFKLPRIHLDHMRKVCGWWESITGLELEEAVYNRMFIKDVNNYIAESVTGNVKHKGKYEYKRGWHQNHSSLVIPKAAEAFLMNGVEPMDFLMNHDDCMDFMLRAKVPKTSRLMLGDRRIQNVSRYFISTTGEPLLKVMPPLPKNPTKEREIGINVGWGATECNDITGGYYPENIDYKFYATEVEKLISFGR